MNQVKKLFINFAPAIATISLWTSYIVYGESLIAAILMSSYTVVLYLSKSKNQFDGIIEIKETEEGGKSFQLVINKDPETLQDQDQVIFLFKDVS